MALDQSKVYTELQTCASSYRYSPLTEEKCKSYCIRQADWCFSYAASGLDEQVLNLFQDLVDEQHVLGRYASLRNGEICNVSEERAVLHHKVRSLDPGFYGEEQRRATQFVEEVHSGKRLNVNGDAYTTVVNIGIGGSDLGPSAVYHALNGYSVLNGIKQLDARFLANIDPDDAWQTVQDLDLERTLFIVVSKSGSTLETNANLDWLKQYWSSQGLSEEQFHNQLLVVTSKGSVLDTESVSSQRFYIDDAIGGRYSVTSVVGGLVLSLCFGSEVFDEFLLGARDMDNAAALESCRDNMALMSALIGVWETTCRRLPLKGIIPYSEALSLFPAHLQQLDCESNGKQAMADGSAIQVPTGPFIFGGAGTRLQHSLFQYLHQSPQLVPLQFIGFRKSQSGTSGQMQAQLNANLVAQIVALSKGQISSDLTHHFPGERPTTLLIADQLTPRTLGALVSFYENVVMFQGFLWGLNSFDQPGVELGKKLAKDVLSEDSNVDPVLKALYDFLK